MMMGGFGWEVFIYAFQVLLLIVGVIVVPASIVVKRLAGSGVSRCFFYAYSILCVAQLWTLSRLVYRLVYWGDVGHLGVWAWLSVGVVCLIAAAFMYLKERAGGAFGSKFYSFLFLIFAVLPWGWFYFSE